MCRRVEINCKTEARVHRAQWEKFAAAFPSAWEPSHRLSDQSNSRLTELCVADGSRALSWGARPSLGLLAVQLA